MSSAGEDDLSDSAAQVLVARSSLRKKKAVSSARYFHLDYIIVLSKMRPRPLTLSMIEDPSRTTSDSESAEDPLSEHQVQNFMEHVHEDLEGAKDLAHSLEHTLQRKYQSGKETLRRASKDLTSSVTEAIGGVAGHRHDRGHRLHHEESSWCGTVLSELKYHLGCNCGFSACWTDAWKKIHDVSSCQVFTLSIANLHTNQSLLSTFVVTLLSIARIHQLWIRLDHFSSRVGRIPVVGLLAIQLRGS